MAPELEAMEPGVADALIHMGQFLKRLDEDPEFAASLEAQRVEGNPITISPGTPDADTWVSDMIDGADKNKERWKRNSLNPKRDPLKAAVEAEPYYEAQVKKAIDGKHYSKGLGQVSLTDLGDAIEATDPSEYANGISKRKGKITKKVVRLVELHKGRKDYVDRTKPDSAANRKKRMNDNYDAMIAMGIAMKTGGSLAVKGS